MSELEEYKQRVADVARLARLNQDWRGPSYNKVIESLGLTSYITNPFKDFEEKHRHAPLGTALLVKSFVYVAIRYRHQWRLVKAIGDTETYSTLDKLLMDLQRLLPNLQPEQITVVKLFGAGGLNGD